MAPPQSAEQMNKRVSLMILEHLNRAGFVKIAQDLQFELN
jgi:hypothetical protein